MTGWEQVDYGTDLHRKWNGVRIEKATSERLDAPDGFISLNGGNARVMYWLFAGIYNGIQQSESLEDGKAEVVSNITWLHGNTISRVTGAAPDH